MTDNNGENNDGIGERLILQLFVSGMSQKSMEAVENVKLFCDKYLAGRFELEIIDLYKNPEAASEQQIVFSPSLVKKFPLPKKTLIGTFENTDKIIKALGIKVKV
ncbi:MAG: circadian clock KaiB family protein [Agriterribacter sp.]